MTSSNCNMCSSLVSLWWLMNECSSAVADKSRLKVRFWCLKSGTFRAKRVNTYKQVLSSRTGTFKIFTPASLTEKKLERWNLTFNIQY
jgi:hypothetical protein